MKPLRNGMAAGATALAAVVIAGAVVASEDKHASWSYEGETGPEAWHELNEANAACAGEQQSPIDLAGAVEAELEDIEINWQPVALGSVVHNGHTIQVNTPDSGGIVLNGEDYKLLQFHFHGPSEHAVDGEPYPMEIHFVHASEEGALAVIGVLVAEGEADATLAEIWSVMPTEPGEASSDATIDMTTLLPESDDLYRYAGSLTTPPCSEIVIWTVMEQPITASSVQIKAFGEAVSPNARPLQALNRRFLLSSE